MGDYIVYVLQVDPTKDLEIWLIVVLVGAVAFLFKKLHKMVLDDRKRCDADIAALKEQLLLTERKVLHFQESQLAEKDKQIQDLISGNSTK